MPRHDRHVHLNFSVGIRAESGNDVCQGHTCLFCRGHTLQTSAHLIERHGPILVTDKQKSVHSGSGNQYNQHGYSVGLTGKSSVNMFGKFDGWLKRRLKAGRLSDIQSGRPDITEQKEREILLAHAVESTSELICITDLQDRFIFVNQAFLRVHGYTETEVLGRTPGILYSPRNPATLLPEVLRQTRLGGWRGEVLDLRKDGTEFPIHLSTSLVKDGSGRVIGLLGVARDITERKRAEESLRLLSSAVEQSNEAIVITDGDVDRPGPRILFVNPAFTKMTGYTTQEALGNTPRMLQGPRSDRAVLKNLRQTLMRGEPFLGEVINYRKDRTEYCVDLHITPIRDADGVVTRFVAIQHDITERRRAEERIAVLAHAVKSTSDMICITDLQDRLTFVNQAFLRAYGYEEHEILGKTPDIVFSPNTSPTTLGEILDQTRSGGWRGEVMDRRKDGTEFPVSLSTSQILDHSGKVIGLMGVARDITERKKDQESLRESEQRFRVGFEAAPDGMAIAGADGRFLQVNPAFCKMLGYPEKELLTKTIRDVTDPRDLDTTDSYIDHLLKGPMLSHETEKRYLHKLGHAVWARVTVSLVRDKSDRPHYIIGYIQDLTERKQLEKEILEISDREQGRIGQDLHDGLCQQLVSTAFASNLLSQRLETIAPAEAGAARKIAGWVDEAISQARTLARGLYPVKLEADGLASALQELAEYVNDRFEIPCALENTERVLLTDNTVATHLYRITQEAVTNAVKHSHAHQIGIKLASGDGSITVSVQDDGVGIPDVISHGMGLHIMQYRTRMIGGTLNIRRGSHGGTVVVCTFRTDVAKS